MRYRWIAILAAAAAVVMPAAHAAEKYPARAVRIIVPFPPGEAADTIARLVAPVVA